MTLVGRPLGRDDQDPDPELWHRNGRDVGRDHDQSVSRQARRGTESWGSVRTRPTPGGAGVEAAGHQAEADDRDRQQDG
jgi:hypothetical protein